MKVKLFIIKVTGLGFVLPFQNSEAVVGRLSIQASDKEPAFVFISYSHREKNDWHV